MFRLYFEAEYELGFIDGKKNKPFDGLSFAYHLGWRDGQRELARARIRLQQYTAEYFRGGTRL